MSKIIGFSFLLAFSRVVCASDTKSCPDIESHYRCERTFSIFVDPVEWAPTQLTLHQKSSRLEWEFGSLVGDYVLDGKVKTRFQFGQRTQARAACENGKSIVATEIFATPTALEIVRQLEITKNRSSLGLMLITSLFQGSSVVDESEEHWKCQSSPVSGSQKKSR